jgi:hypothetical protein
LALRLWKASAANKGGRIMMLDRICRLVVAAGGAVVLAGCGAVVPSCNDGCVGDFSALDGAYLGQRPPGVEPELFAPGFVSTGLKELNSVFTPDGDEFYFAVDVGPRFVLMMTRRLDSGWTEPEILTFSERSSAVDLAFTADGDRMLFCSNRPHSGGLHPQDNYDIWWSDRRNDGSWDEPRRLGGSINTDRNEFYPSLTEDGTLYFLSSGHGGQGGSDIFRASPRGDGFGTPENLGPIINTEQSEGDAFIARDESYLIFVSSGHEREPNEGRLFVSFRSDHGWSEPQNLGRGTATSDYCPVVSPDGRYFFFTGTRTRFDQGSAPMSYDTLLAGLAKPQNGQDDIYWVDVEFVTRLRPGAGSAAMM